MKNLQSIIRRNIDFHSEVVCYCIDSDNGFLFALTNGLRLFKTQLYGENVAIEEQNLEDKISSHIGNKILVENDVRLFEFVVEMGGLLLALKSGHLLIISLSLTDCHCLYKHGRMISSISLSPSQDLIALADDDNGIQVMYCSDCDIINKSNALTQNESLHKPVGVGWGSKETQFFGLDGRPSQEKQEAARVQPDSDEITTSDHIENSAEYNLYQSRQERSTVIDWRGDGQLIGTLTYIPESNKHYLKVWNRNLELQYMSEQLVTVERGLLCWIPDGRYLCCAQRRDRRLNEVTLFEKNGLVRQRISLPAMMKDMYIGNMAWCSDSKIFALIVKQFHVVGDGIQVDNILMMYTMQNWHYYLKSTTKLRSNCDYSLKWDVTNINRLHIMSSSGHYTEFDCCFQITSSDQNSTVVVVDANKVLLTPFEMCIVPPPMSAITLETQSPIYKLAIDSALASDIFILTLDGDLFYTFEKSSQTDQPASPLVEGLKVSLNNQVAQKLHEILENYSRVMVLDAQSYQHLIPVGGLNLVASKLTPTGSEIIRIKLPRSQHEQTEFETLKTFERNQVISLSRCALNKSKNLSIILNDSSCFILNLNTGKVVPLSDYQLTIAESRYSYNIIDSQTVDSPTSETAVISLGQDYCLQFNKTVLASNSCTSFRLTENYLIYTTLENSIHFILLSNILVRAADDGVDSWQQQIETGATIVTASENNSKVVLQMPRGNLETIHPRVLLFSSLTILLDQKKYVEACKLARRHRINMNFLVDYLMRLDGNFESYWASFAEAIADHDPNLLCLILTELDNGDTISGRYQGIVRHLPKRQSDFHKNDEINDKVNRFCSIINLSSEQKFLSPRIQRFLRMEPKRTESALNIVYSLDKNLRLDAIKYILYFIDIDQLFRDALSTYNTDIALMVASASNKDPKQYLALIDEFKAIEEVNVILYRYSIDLNIKRYDRAFDNLCSFLLSIQDSQKIQETQEELLNLVVSKRIYRHAICHLESLNNCNKNCDYQFDRANRSDNSYLDKLTCYAWAKYAEYLLEKRHYDEAGLAYSKALITSGSVEHFNSALKCYSLIEDWEKSMALIRRCEMNLGLKVEASRKLTKQLMERSKYNEATIIELLSSRNFESTIALDWTLDLPNPGNWYLAEIIAGSELGRFPGRGDLIKCADMQLDSWSNELGAAREQFERLKELLTTQQKRQDTLPERGFVSDSLSTVDGSEVSSMSGSEGGQQVGKVARSGATSIKTRSSGKSAKSSHKRINLKAGSRHEDLALVLELKKFISKQSSNHEECSRYLGTLFQYLSSIERAYGYLTRFRDTMTKSLEFAQEVSELLWPIGPHLEQRYSLYARLSQTLSTETPENVDFEILIRPEPPKTLNIFDI